MTKPIPRSRLHITYRTKIDGTPKKAKLPMRFLVLGDFTAHDHRGLGERPVHSIMPGMELSSFMNELKLSSRIDEPSLKESLFGGLEGTITGKFMSKPKLDPNTNAAGGKTKIKVTGTGVVSGKIADNGLGSFSGTVEITGEIDVPYIFRGKEPIIDTANLFAANATYDGLRVFGKVEPAEDTTIGATGVTGNVEHYDQGRKAYVPLGLKAATLTKLPEDPNLDPDSIDAEQALAPTKVSHAKVPVDLTIPLRSMNHFKPLHLAAMVPEIRRLVLLRSLALETRNYLANYPSLRDLVKKELTVEVEGKPGGRFPALREKLKTDYPQLLVEPPAPAPAPAPDTNTTPNPGS